MKDQLNAILQKRWTLPAATAVAGLGVGSLVGYMFTKKQYDRIEAQLARSNEETERLEKQFHFDFKDAALDAEVERRVAMELEKRMPHIVSELGYSTETEEDDDEAREVLREDHPASVSRSGRARRELEPFQRSMNERLGTITDIRETQDGIEVEGTVTPIGKFIIDAANESKQRNSRRGVITNVFDNGGDEWDYKTEIEARDKTRPYTIHVDEYVTDEMGWDSQSTLTWYEGDKILTDSHDHPIHNPNEVVGLPLAFGHGSNDPNVVYIRNERLQAEYEILRDAGSYQEIVLGEALEAAAQSEDLRHSHQMKFRSD